MKRKKPAGQRQATAVIARLDEIEHEQGGTGSLELDTGTLAVSRLEKVFFPATRQTKGDLMRYYAGIAPQILPAISNRPLVMRRFPNGVRGKAFYQHRAPASPPTSVRVESVADEGIQTLPRLIGGDLATLLYVVQLGAISIDPWSSRTPRVEYADYAIIDLDPGSRAAFSSVIDVARWIHDELASRGLRGLPKTSGATGIHIMLPLPRRTSNQGARVAAQEIANAVADAHPKIATVRRAVQARGSARVYVDYLQNIRGKTVACAYSARAQPTATVSTPLSWDEVRPGLDPREFTIATVPDRVRNVGDLWATSYSS